MRHDETEKDTRNATLRVRAATLEVVEGPNRGLRARVDAPTVIVGTGDTVDVFLSDTTVSRAHVHLTLLPNGLRVRDEGSRNGTWIGPLRVTDALVVGDVGLRLGSTVLAIHLDATTSDIALSPDPAFGPALGVSVAMRYVFALLERIAPTATTLLLEGESGVGKDMLARAVHERSARAAGPFVAVDCGSIPPNLIESELFGHVRGAFTGASDARVGLFEQADGGTLFLDEIGELPLEQQTRLLRVLETRELKPVGSNRARPIDVRVIAATNRRLDDQVRKGAFRDDLFFRLAIVRVRVPPLRDRPEDVLLLGTSFLREMTGDPRVELPQDLAGMLLVYPWPGNVRELRNAVQRYAVLGQQGLFESRGIQGNRGTDSAWFDGLEELSFHDARRMVLERFEHAYLPRVLEREGGVVSRAAAHAGVARQSFHRMMKRLGIAPEGHDAD